MKKNFNGSPKMSLIKLNLVLLTAISGLTTSPLMAQRGGRSASTAAPARMVNKEDSAYIRNNYKKMEIMIPMRDGVKLYTAVYVPKDETKSYPIMLSRSPYGSGPYGADIYKTSLGPSMIFAKEGFIFAYQDARGRYMSEGDFVATRPYVVKKTNKDIDESSDTYDTIDWMIKNLPHNNGKVGTWGISAPGFYTTMTAIEAHPALKAVSPQAPVTNWFMGDDRHHNGAFQEMGTFAFLSSFGAPRPVPTPISAPAFSAYGTPDGYDFYLNMGPLKNFDDKILHHTNKLWDDMMEHDTYDEYWKSRTPEPHLKNIVPAMLTVGGFFDQEDPYGPLKVNASIEKGGHKDRNILVMGPWYHGGFSRGDGETVGNIQLGSKTGVFYRENIEFPFFMHYLKDAPDPQLPNAYMFETGTNVWKKYSKWPPEEAKQGAIYLQPDNKLAFTAPQANTKMFDAYVSDPAKPVPYSAEIRTIRGSEFMVEDQRFAGNRPDVLVYETEVLDKDVTVAGNVTADLFVSTTGTDADFVVKVIDVYPGDAPDNAALNPAVKMGGFEMLVRGEIMRAKFRNDFGKPEAMVPGKVTEVKWDVEDINHTFLKGHKIMFQIQSTWFPLNDRNPQKFVNIYKANESDFQKATNKVYFTPQYPSHVDVKLIEK
ncbi:CocE/NonD family hydrolase [Mucilaginibacter sp.]|uniref:CocE/NonD family hydrolase n=1 Tax=Mucilaginibacter sp. TaxID=1882438 RepID=UPI00261252B6|nr:CocE/NonD family hydrolase [Mucilaginibacter sp.]MDB5030463.1 X-Pro dipeptidyl-peptidase [Mucilaginibacter sp.]